MTIEITAPEVEAIIQQRLRDGGFKNAEDVILQALQSFPEAHTRGDAAVRSNRSLREVFESVKGLADDLDFSRNSSVGRPVNLS